MGCRQCSAPLLAATGTDEMPLNCNRFLIPRYLAAGIGLLLLALALAPGDGVAKDNARFERAVNMAGVQRTLAQQIGKEALLVALGVDKENNLKRLQESHAKFQRITAGLRAGDAELGLTATTEPELLRHINRVDQLWASVDQLLAVGLKGEEIPQEQVIAVAEMTEPLYSVVDELVKALRLEAQKGQIVFSINLLAIDYATRQSMLSQKLTKELLLVAYGHAVEKNRKALARSSSHFDRVLKGLLDGDLQLRLREAPTPEIRIELQKALKMWSGFLPSVEGVANGQEVNPELLNEVSDLNLSLLATIDSATNLYESL